MNKIAFYIMNLKGYFVLNKFIQNFGANNIDYIVSAEDKNSKKDYFIEIKNIADKYDIIFFKKYDNFSIVENKLNGYKFAIGWRWLIKNDMNLIIFHDSILPKYRGFAPLINTLICGDRRGE